MITSRRVMFVLAFLISQLAYGELRVLEDADLRFVLNDETGTVEVIDKSANVTWGAAVDQNRFGSIKLLVDGQSKRVELRRCKVQINEQTLRAEFDPIPAQPAATLAVFIRLQEGGRVDVRYEASEALQVDELVLLDGLLGVTDASNGYVAVPVREGLLIPADSGVEFMHRFDTYTYEGCHMAMAGVNREGGAALITWSDPYLALNVQSRTNVTGTAYRQLLTPSFALRKSAREFSLRFLGKGDYVTIAKAYRDVAKERGWLVTWEDKLKDHPERAKLFGAINYKLWSTLDRRMNQESTREESVKVNWTFEEAAAVAAHLRNDLKLDKVLFTLGGWIHRGYDNQHPDILPAAPECGGDTAFADCARRVMDLGYIFCLHDNYQDIYRDSPSWDENYVMKTPDGKLSRGGHWAGGVAYLTCAKMALELARRPQNLPAVRELTKANSFFIDTTYAAGLQECFDPNHPLTRLDDMKWKQALSDYAREIFGMFGSECGREWAIPHSDFFEGLTGVSGGYYHDAKLTDRLGATVIPLFELVYRDCIAMYGKYGYDPFNAAGYVLHHVLLGRPLNYHSIPQHLYWKNPANENLPLKPRVAEFAQTGARRFKITYGWNVDGKTSADYRVFVHFTDSSNKILFQNDHAPQPPLAEWTQDIRQGPFELTVPEGVTGQLNVRMGLFSPSTGERLLLQGRDTGERSYLVGRMKVEGDKLQFEAVTPSLPGSGDPALFTRAHNGWAAGMHPMDRFVKNTYEILSPLNEITSRQQMNAHEFLTPDRKVQRSVLGTGDAAVQVTINTGSSLFTVESPLGGKLVLPANGFIVEGAYFAAFHATKWNGKEYSEPVIFTLRSADGSPLKSSKRVRVYHAMGDDRIAVGKAEVSVPSESVIQSIN